MSDSPAPDPMSDSVVRFTTHPATTWWIRHVASRLDPILFRWTNGRWFSMGKASMPMVTITTRGARSGKERLVHLAAIPDGDDWLVVASAMGQQKHPAWSYNLEAHPEVEIQLPGERYRARATRLGDAERDALWPRVHEVLPQMAVYEGRTERRIKLYRLERI